MIAGHRSYPPAMHDPERVTAEDLAARAGVTLEHLRELAAAGVIASDEDGRFSASSITAIRYAEAFLASGTPLSAITEASQRGLLYFDTLELLYIPVPQTSETLESLAARLGIATGILVEALTAIGLPVPGPGQTLRADDVRVLELLVASWSARRVGRPGQWLTRAALGYGDVMRRLAKLEHGLFLEAHAPDPMWVVQDADERRKASLDAGADLARAGEIVSLLHARAMEQTIAEASVAVTEAVLERQGVLEPVGRRASPTVAFVDVSGFTALSQEAGDEHAATIASRFAGLAQTSVHAADGRLVKMLGDGVLLLFRDADAAAAAVTRLFEDAHAAGLPSLHAGVHTGPVIERDADVFGRTVNLAARISGQAGQGQILVSADTAAALDTHRWTTTSVGDVELKGVGGPVRLFRLSSAEPEPIADPTPPSD